MGYNSNEIFTIIETIAATASKNEKQALVTQHVQDEAFLKVVCLAYDPFITFGVRNIPQQDPLATADGQFSEATWNLFSKLSSRELSGNAARDAIQYEINRLNPQSAELLARVLRKNLRADFSESTINKAMKGAIKEFPYMRCSLLKEVKVDQLDFESDGGAFSQEKADGTFANVSLEESGVVMATTRQGTLIPIEAFKGFEEEVRSRLKPGTQTHGEFLVLRDGVTLSRKEGNGVLNHVLKGGSFAENEVPLYLAWDQIPLEAVKPKGRCNTPYKDRFAALEEQIGNKGVRLGIIPTRRVKSLKEAYAHYIELLGKGKEGTVIKFPNAEWFDGTSKEQIKLKLEVEVDLEVVAIQPGKAGSKIEGRAGALSCRSSCGNLAVDVTVKNEAMRDQVDANPDDWIGRIVPLLANELLEPGKNNDLYSLFLPRMAEAAYRTDKVVADDLERIRLCFESAKMGLTPEEYQSLMETRLAA